MRTSGGVDASRRLRDATRRPLPSLTTLLFTLLFLCSLVASESAPQPSQSREWRPQESHVTVSADGIATSRGAGRRRSDGLSITRGIPVDSAVPSDAPVDDQAIKFTPARVDLGRMETCSPQRYYVGVENRGRVSVRLDGADFTHDGFSLATDVRGIRLDPGDKFNVQFVFLPSQVEPNGVDAHLRLLTTSGLFALPISSPEVVMNRYGVRAIEASTPPGVRFGQTLQFVNPLDHTIRITEIYALDSFVHLELLDGSNWIGPRWPRDDDDDEIDEVPGEYDKEFDYARRSDRGGWDMPAGTTNPLIKVSLHTSTPGVYFTYIHIAAGERRLLLVPVRFTVMKPGIHIEPKEMDLGVLTDLHANEHREILFTLYNAGVNPIEVLELKVLKSNLIVSAQLWGGSAVIPPRTQISNALAVQIRVDKETPGGPCFASLLLKTNATGSELGQRKLKLYGRVVHGSMAFHLNETSVGVVMPLEKVFYGEGANSTTHENEKKMSTTKLISIIDENSTMGIMAGTSAFRNIRLWNQFDCFVELQRVWMDSTLPHQDEPEEVSVHKFKQGAVCAGAAWPQISLQISPTLQGKANMFSVRSYSLMVETNVSLHRIKIHVYHGFLRVNSSRGLQDYSVSGYYNDSQKQNSSQTCLVVPKGGLVTPTSLHIGRGRRKNTQGVKICRSLLFDLEKVASHQSRTEVVKMVNENPVPLSLVITTVYESDIIGISIWADVTLTHSDNSSDNSANRVTRYWNNTLRRTSTNNGTNIVTSGDHFVLQPGYQVVFRVMVLAQDTLGELTSPIMSVKTPIEVLHLYTRLWSVQGSVEPVTPIIMLPSMFPGRTKVIHLQYRNTFDHSVTPLSTTMSSSNLKILSMRDEMAPNQVVSVLDLLFSPAADSKCSNAQFLADCLMPQQVSTADETCEYLSGFGALVDENDLMALRRRDVFWSERDGDGHQLTLEAHVSLQTDIMESVQDVAIKAVFERPLVSVSTATSLKPGYNSSNIFGRKEFELTELLDLSRVFVKVRNPSNVSIQMELAIAETDQALFYSCKEDPGVNGELSGKTNDKVENDHQDSSSYCLTEWTMAAGDAVSLQRERQVDIDVPPFFFQHNIIQVPAGGESQLGPIYYLPSKVQEITTTMFVRNDLTHIEPVSLFARSGKGTLDVVMDMSAANSKSMKSLYIARGDTDIIFEGDAADNSGNFEYDGTLKFELTERDASTDYTQGAEILVLNTGPFGLRINNLTVIGSSAVSWRMPTSNDFLVTLEKSKQRDSKSGQMVLPPGKTARIHVSFYASCVAATVTNWLIIDTSDNIKRIRLQGTITTQAAFSCLRSRMASSLRYVFHYTWLLAATAATISTLYTVFLIVYDTWTDEAKHEVQPLKLVVDNEDPSTEVALNENHDSLEPKRVSEDNVPPRNLVSINRLLEDMEGAEFVSSARVVTPAVSKVLDQRRKGLCWIVQNSEHVHFNKDAKRGDRENSTLLTVTNAEIIQNPTTRKAHSHGVKEVAKESGSTHADHSRSSTPVFAGASVILEGDDDSDSLSDESSSESPEIASPHSTIATEAASRDPDFPKLSFGFTDGQLKPALGPNRPMNATLSQKAEGPFEAFKSLSERWREQDWQDEPSGHFLGVGDWNGTLSLNTVSPGWLDTNTANQRNENVRSGNRSESNSFIGTSSGLFLEGFPPFAAPAAPSLSTPKPSTKNAPPGFTPADAQPLESRAAFERLRNNGNATHAIATTSSTSDGNSLFANKLPLFGPALPPKYDDQVTLGSVGRIGSGRSKVLRGLNTSPTK